MMTAMSINFFALRVFSELFEVSAFIEMFDNTLPASECRADEALRQLAEEEQWDFNEYQVERDQLAANYRLSFPRLAAYSVVVILYSVVETRLLAIAERIGRDSAFRVQDMGGAARH